MIKNKRVNHEFIKALAANYDILDYSEKLADLLKIAFPSEDFNHFSKYELHRLLNDTLCLNYNGEEILKYKLFKCHLNKNNLVGAFEIKVNNSRLDFLTINGSTTSFEIKSELDNLSKLPKQMADYMLAFEYNYLVLDECHIEKVKDLLPENFGLWSYIGGRYKKSLKANLNDKINPEVQLRLLTKPELVNYFPEIGGVVKDILNLFDPSYINSQFKKALKFRYSSRWEFILANESEILPIDLQFFFNTNIQPELIYKY